MHIPRLFHELPNIHCYKKLRNDKNEEVDMEKKIKKCTWHSSPTQKRDYGSLLIKRQRENPHYRALENLMIIKIKTVASLFSTKQRVYYSDFTKKGTTKSTYK